MGHVYQCMKNVLCCSNENEDAGTIWRVFGYRKYEHYFFFLKKGMFGLFSYYQMSNLCSQSHHSSLCGTVTFLEFHNNEFLNWCLLLVITTTGKEFPIFLVFLPHNQPEANDICSLFSCP